MRRIDVEEWAFRILERIQHGQSNEDSLVELKSTWPDARDIARQLGGHANSARAQTIMWLFGVDERTGVVPFEPQDPASWRDQLYREFDGIAPRFEHYNIEWQGQSFFALVFETDAAPFVVLNPQRNRPGSGPFDREVPWREGRTRSASRAELILIVRPPARLPIVEIVSGRVTVMDQATSHFHSWNVDIDLYGVTETLGRMFFPFFGIRAHLETSNGAALQFENFGINANTDDPHVVYTRNQQLMIDGAARFHFYGTARSDTLSQDLQQPLRVEIRLMVAGNELPVIVTVQLKPTAERHQFTGAWIVTA